MPLYDTGALDNINCLYAPYIGGNQHNDPICGTKRPFVEKGLFDSVQNGAKPRLYPDLDRGD
jgi:hypothetical protein